MKLSMWMIANRLSGFDMEIRLDENAPAVLNSARMAYATNCVYIYADKEDTICRGEGGSIRLRNIDVIQSFEVIQGIFDFYQDWAAQVEKAARESDFQKVAGLSYIVFHNPLVIFDANQKVLGITKQYDENSLDNEWAYIYKYGYASLNAIDQLRHRYSGINFSRHGEQSFGFDGSQMMMFTGLSYCLEFADNICGRINLFSYERQLNAGDCQVLEFIARQLEPVMGYPDEKGRTGNNVFFNVLSGRPYDRSLLDHQLRYYNWDAKSRFSLALIKVAPSGPRTSASDLDNILHTVSMVFSGCIVLKKVPYIMVLTKGDLSRSAPLRTILEEIAKNNPVKIGFSLPCSTIENAVRLFPQAEAAIQFGEHENRENNLYCFYDIAAEYIIASPSVEKSMTARMPGVDELYTRYIENGDDLWNTLKCFLDNERSYVQTSADLNMHRNTVIYRIKKAQEFLSCDLADVYDRNYLWLSMQITEIHSKLKASENPDR